MSCQQVPTTPAFNLYPRSVQVGEFEVAIDGGIWVAIRELQFGCDYEGKHGHGDFCRSFKLALRRVLIVYPTAWVCVKRGGIELRQSEPPVPPRTWLTSETHRPRTHQALKNKEAA